jgi:hypothetical protein
MRLYYFDIEEDGVWTADEQGSEWPSLAEADAEAVRTLTEMARESFPVVTGNWRSSFETGMDRSSE